MFPNSPLPRTFPPQKSAGTSCPRQFHIDTHTHPHVSANFFTLPPPPSLSLLLYSISFHFILSHLPVPQSAEFDERARARVSAGVVNCRDAFGSPRIHINGLVRSFAHFQQRGWNSHGPAGTARTPVHRPFSFGFTRVCTCNPRGVYRPPSAACMYTLRYISPR